MNFILSALGAVFGFGKGQSVLNTVGGAVTHAAMLPALIYLVDNANKQIQLGSVSMGLCAIVAGFCYVMIELMRRTAPGSPG